MMQEELKVTIVQSDLVWEQPEANRRMFSEKIASISETTDLIVLPEMFTTGFTMNASNLAEENNGKTVSWMKEQAIKYNTAITGSIIISENNNYYNRLFFVFPDGSYKSYDKRHTFTLAGEQKTYNQGSSHLIVDYKGWKLCPLICYDLRFPVWARNTDAYDVLLYVANWPQKRVAAWDALLKARAIENMAYCIGVNRTGLDANNHKYVGHSAIFDVLGNKTSKLDIETEFIETVTLYKNEIEKNRKHLQFLNDRDLFTLN